MILWFFFWKNEKWEHWMRFGGRGHGLMQDQRWGREIQGSNQTDWPGLLGIQKLLVLLSGLLLLCLVWSLLVFEWRTMVSGIVFVNQSKENFEEEKGEEKTFFPSGIWVRNAQNFRSLARFMTKDLSLSWENRLSFLDITFMHCSQIFWKNQ